MAGTTPNFNLSTLSVNDAFSADGYKFTDADRILIDRLLNAALTHDHTGDPPGIPGETVEVAPTVILNPLEGSLPAGLRYFYKVALVGPDGLATQASPEAMVDAPQPIQAPDAPVATRSATDGTLLPGGYYYRLSVYRGANTLETVAGDPVSVPLPVADGTTQRVILSFPTMPVGGDGFNIYRRIPGGSGFNFLASVTTAEAADPWIDTGATAPNCERFAPTSNTTSSSNSVEITYPGGVVPVGYTWRIYRTDMAGDWSYSVLTNVVEETSEGSGIITPTFTDLGFGTTAGAPPAVSPPTIPTPAQVSYLDLTDVPDPGVMSTTGITNLERLTQAEYDLLDPPDPDTVYIIVG